MIRPLFRTLVGFLSIAALATSVSAGDVFPDPNLESVIKAILKKKQIEKEQIDPADLKTIYFLDARKKGITNLTGLEHCINLAEVKLSDNEIEDLAPLAGLKNIQSLYLSRNKIQDISPVGNLVKIQYLEIEGNAIESLAGLEKLENLRALYAEGNRIEDLSPLSGLKKISSLYLDDNRIADLRPVKDLPWVSSLGLKKNKIKDLSPLAGYTELHYTFLEGESAGRSHAARGNGSQRHRGAEAVRCILVPVPGRRGTS